VVTSGGSDPEVVVNYLNSVMTKLRYLEAGQHFCGAAQISDPDEKARLIAEARDLVHAWYPLSKVSNGSRSRKKSLVSHLK